MTDDSLTRRQGIVLSGEALSPLAYESHHHHPLATSIRALGAAFLILATIALAMVPLWIFTANRSFSYITRTGDRSLFIAWLIVGTIVNLSMVLFQITASIALMRLRPRATHLARAWAYASLACSALNVAVNLYFQFHSYSRAFDLSIIAYIVAYFIERWAMGMTVPMFVLVFTRSAAFQEALNPS